MADDPFPHYLLFSSGGWWLHIWIFLRRNSDILNEGIFMTDCWGTNVLGVRAMHTYVPRLLGLSKIFTWHASHGVCLLRSFLSFFDRRLELVAHAAGM